MPLRLMSTQWSEIVHKKLTLHVVGAGNLEMVVDGRVVGWLALSRTVRELRVV